MNKISDYLVAIILFLLLNVLVFHNGFYGRICRVDSYAGDAYGRISVLKKLENHHGKNVIALIGDSTTEEGIGAKELAKFTGEPVANLALPGTAPLEWFHYLQSVDPQRNRFQIVILTISPQNMRGRPHEDGFQTLLAVATIPSMLSYTSRLPKSSQQMEYFYAAFDRIFAFRRDLRDLFLSPSRLMTIHRQKREQILKLEDWPGERINVCGIRLHPKSGKVVDWAGIQDPQMRKFAENALERTEKLNKKPVVSGILEPLEEILGYYEKSPTKILIITIPFGLQHNIAQNARPIQRYYSLLDKFADFPNVHHWNAVHEPVFQDCKNFYDFRHLNATGRQQFSTRLAEELKKLNSGKLQW